MTKKLFKFTLLMLLTTVAMWAQVKKEWGEKFDYEMKLEQDPKVVMADNYNHYMMTVACVDGMTGQHAVIIRKFDQKNNLVNTFTQDFPNKDMFTLYNYLGSYEIGKDKVVVFTDSYSNKTKKKEIHKIVFDKKTDTFTTTLIVSYTFESLSKSGTATLVASQNGAYFALVYAKFSNRKIAEIDECTLIDGKTLEVLWQKTNTFSLEYYSGDMTVTNSGKIVIVKRVVEKGLKHSFRIVTADAEVDKVLDANIKITNPLAISIGTQDYLIAFNFDASNREWFYTNIMLYDLQEGRVLNNDKIDVFTGIKDFRDIKGIKYNYVNVHDNQIDLFVECNYKTGSKPSSNFSNDPRFNDPVYGNGLGTLLVMSSEGKIKSNTKLDVIPFGNEVVYSYGLLNYQGNYYINTAGFTNKGVEFGTFYKLEPNATVKNSIIEFNYNVSEEQYLYGSFIHQFCNYFPDSKRMLFAKYFSDGKIAFVSFKGVSL